MTRYNLQEWREIDSILKTFCLASRLQINVTKSTFHYSGISGVELESYKAIFSYNFIKIFVGQRYLRFFLKEDRYKATDWRWLLIKFEKKIGF
jgi:hypothetical protein